MKKPIRLSLIAVACAAGLALAATALPASSSRPLAVQAIGSAHSFQAYNPELFVQQSSYKVGAPTNVGFILGINPSDDATAKITIFSPSGYTNTLTQMPGTVIGKAFAIVRAGALGGADLTLKGNVVVGNPADPALMTAYGQCKSATDPSTPQAVWVLDTQLQGQSLKVPAFVNVNGPYLTQEICLLPPAAAPFQAQLWLANFTINGVFKNAGASSAYHWAGDFTPYVMTTPNPAGTKEFQSYVGLPSSLTFKRGKSKNAAKVAFGGKLAIFGVNPAGIKLDLFASTKAQPAPSFLDPSKASLANSTVNNLREVLFNKPAGRVALTVKLKAKGTYTLLQKKPKKKSFFQLRFDPFWGFSTCQAPSPTGLPIPCLGEGIAPMTTAQLAVAPAKKHHK